MLEGNETAGCIGALSRSNAASMKSHHHVPECACGTRSRRICLITVKKHYMILVVTTDRR